uniref:Endoplasmic reticulum aminopeptidase 2 n=1 Tax=Aceria tosichella TaxID=561515 RepID=A0A6G1S5I6_9ACAR
MSPTSVKESCWWRSSVALIAGILLLVLIINATVVKAELPPIKYVRKLLDELPINIVPNEYDIELTFMKGFVSFEGKVDILVEFKKLEPNCLFGKLCNKMGFTGRPDNDHDRKSVDVIAMNMDRHMELKDVSVSAAATIEELRGGKGNKLKIKRIEQFADDGFQFRMAKWLPLGSYGLISIKYISPRWSEALSGKIYDANKQSGQLYHGINLKKTRAHLLLPCFNEPQFKAKIGLTINQPDLESCVIANMPPQAPESEQDEIIPHKESGLQMRRTRFQKTSVAMPIGSLVFAIGPYHKVVNSAPLSPPEQASNTMMTRISLFEPAGHSGQSEFALDFASEAVGWFINELKLEPIDMKELSLVAVPSAKSWEISDGLCIGLINHERLLIDKSMSSPERKIEVALNVALVVARQWFGNWAVPKEVNEKWITEGLAFHLAIRAVRELRPDYQVDQFVRTHHQWRAEAEDSKRYTKYNSSPSYLLEMVANEELVDMLRANIVHDNGRFDQIVRELAKTMATRGAFEYDLFSNEEFTAEEVRAMIYTNRFNLLNKKLEVDLMPLNRVIIISCSGVGVQYGRYCFWPPSIEVLFVKADYSTSSTIEVPVGKSLGLAQSTIELEGPDWFDASLASADWLKVKLGPGDSPFYRVQYSENLLLRLREPIQTNNKLMSATDKIDLLDQEIDDLEKSKDGRQLEQVIRWYKDESDTDVLLEVMRAIMVWHRYVGIKERDGLKKFKEQIKNYYKAIGGIRETDTETMSEKRLRSLLAHMLVHIRDPEVIKEAREAFQSIGLDNLAAHLRDPIYRAVRTGDNYDEVDEKLWARWRVVSLGEERARIGHGRYQGFPKLAIDED